MMRGSIVSFIQKGRLAMPQSRSAAGRRASTACVSMAGEAKETFAFNARSTAGADDLSGSDVERSKAQALAESFPARNTHSIRAAIASPVCEALWYKNRAASLRRARTRVCDRSLFATSQRANQPPEPTRLHGAVIATCLLRSTALRISNDRDYARQRVAQL